MRRTRSTTAVFITVVFITVVLMSVACGGEMPLEPDGVTAPSLTFASQSSTGMMTISGWIYETAHDGEPPIPLAIVEVRMTDGSRETGRADAEGFYHVAARPGLVTIRASKAGYEPQAKRLQISADSILNFSLQPRPSEQRAPTGRR